MPRWKASLCENNKQIQWLIHRHKVRASSYSPEIFRSLRSNNWGSSSSHRLCSFRALLLQNKGFLCMSTEIFSRKKTPVIDYVPWLYVRSLDCRTITSSQFPVLKIAEIISIRAPELLRLRNGKMLLPVQ